jgi:hypothetical protein
VCRFPPIVSGVTDEPAVEPGPVRPAGEDDAVHDGRDHVDAADATPDEAAPAPGGATVLDGTTMLDEIAAAAVTWPPAPRPSEPTFDGASSPHDLEVPWPPRHRRPPRALLAVSTLLAITLVLATYLLLTTRAYERRSTAWETAARTTGSQLTQTRADLEGSINELAATRDQLSTAQSRITELANEKAQLGDDSAQQRQLADYQARVSNAAGNVATALSNCIDGQDKLIGYLDNPTAYDQTDLARFRSDVQTLCGAATDANAALQRELKQ